MTCWRVKGVLRQCSETSARLFAGSEFLVRFGVRGAGETVTSASKQIRSCTEDEGGSDSQWR